MLIKWKPFCIPTSSPQSDVDWVQTVLYYYIISPVWFWWCEKCSLFLPLLSSLFLSEWKIFLYSNLPRRSIDDWVETVLYSHITSPVWCWLRVNCFVFLNPTTSLVLVEWKLFCIPTSTHQSGVDWVETALYSYLSSPVWCWLRGNCFVFLHHLISLVLIEWKLLCIPTSLHQCGAD